jgi:hypothetical protein
MCQIKHTLHYFEPLPNIFILGSCEFTHRFAVDIMLCGKKFLKVLTWVFYSPVFMYSSLLLKRRKPDKN